MKNSKTCFALILSCLFASSLLGASYIKFDGVEGESKDKAHEGWIDVLSVSQISVPRDAASGMATGKRQHKPVTITKRIDKASPLFASSGNSENNPLHESRMTIEQDGVTYVLNGIKILSAKQKGNTETLTISYTSIKVQPKAATVKSVKTKSVKATDYNSSRSNKNSNH